MTVVLTMAAIIAFYAGASLYVRKASAYLAESDAPWDRLYTAAQRVISDPDVPQEMANFAAATVMCAGCGCLTHRILIDAFLGKINLKSRPPRQPMQDRPPEHFIAVVVNAIYYDSLRAPLSGFLLRRLVFPWLRAASTGEAPARRRTVAKMVTSSKAAISHRPEGKKLLAT